MQALLKLICLYSSFALRLKNSRAISLLRQSFKWHLICAKVQTPEQRNPTQFVKSKEKTDSDYIFCMPIMG
jgi:hypothetical protein